MAIENISLDSNDIFPVLNIFIIIMICKYIIEFYLTSRQLKCLQIKEIPKDLQHYGFIFILLVFFPNNFKIDLNQEEFEKSSAYQFESLAFSLFNQTSKLILQIFFLLSSFYPKIWVWTATIKFINPTSEFQRFCIFFTITYLISKIFDIPSNIYSHFVIEEKHGFNKITFKIWLTDELKGLVLNHIFTFIFVYVYLWIIQRSGELFYIYAEFFVIVFIFIMMLIYPNFIAPLFNKFDEINSGELFEAIKELATKNQFPLSKIYSVDGSKRSSHSNAYFYGFSKNKRIVLFDTLIEQMNTKEILGVLCHELAHWKFNHFWYLLFLALLQIFGIFYIFSFFRHSESLYLSFGYSEKSVLIGTTLFFDLIEPITYIFELLKLKIIRTFEFQADRYAVSQNYAQELARALLVLSKENKSSLVNDPLYAAYYYSHPTFPERIKQLQELCPGINLERVKSKQENEEETQQHIEENKKKGENLEEKQNEQQKEKTLDEKKNE